MLKIKWRGLNWYVFTLFPLIIFFIIALLALNNGEIDPSRFKIIVIQQLLFYAIVLGSTEIALMFGAEDDLYNYIGIGFIIVVISSIILGNIPYSGILSDKKTNWFLGLSIVFTCFWIWRSHQNKRSGVDSDNFFNVKDLKKLTDKSDGNVNKRMKKINKYEEVKL